MPQTGHATNVIRPHAFDAVQQRDGDRLVDALGVDRRTPDALLRTLPFGPGDTTAGVENEIQAAVSGGGDRVDLALTIRESDFFENIRRMAISGDTTPRLKEDLERYLEENPEGY